MPNLKCNAKECKFNCCCECVKEEISIGKWFADKPLDIECQDYMQDKKIFNEEFANDLINEKKDTLISCKAIDCIHNSSAVCVAREITIEPCVDQKAETVCVSYHKNQKSTMD